MKAPRQSKGVTRRQYLRGSAALGAGAIGARYLPVYAQPARAAAVSRRGVIVQSADIVSLDPRNQRAMHNEVVIMAAAEKLVRMSKENYGTLVGQLATGWKLVNDTTWRFDLRPGVKFHNGVDFNSETLKAWMDLYRAESLSKDRVDAIDSIVVVDNHTVHFKTKYPYALLPYQLNAINAIAEPGWATDPDHGEGSVIGTGPYRSVEWEKGQRVRFEINPDWWGWGDTLDRRLEQIDFRPIAESSTRVGALLTGEVDIIRSVPAQDADRVMSSSLAAIEKVAGNRCMNIMLRDDIPPTDDVRVRQALNYAVDIDALVIALHGGNAVKLQGQPVGPTVVGFDPEIPAYPYDPEKAKQLLAEAGYPNGFDIKLDTSSGRYDKDLQVSTAIAGMLAKVGIRAEVVINETAEYAAKYSRTTPTANMFFWSSGNIVPEAENAFNDMLVRPGQKELSSGFHDDDLTKIQEQLKRTLDSGDRLALARAGMRIAHERAPMIFLYQQVDLYGRSVSIDWTPRPDEWILTDEVSVAA